MTIMFNIQKILINPIFRSFCIALIIVCAAFPDVIFQGASLRITDQIMGERFGFKAQSFYPVPAHSQWWGSYNDNGGASFQSEPMMEFMRHSVENGESPYWNPYSAAGSLGPESLVDQKFSAMTLLNAIAGGGSAAYNAILIMLYFGAAFFIALIALDRLKLSASSAVAMTIFYLLNGYSVSNIASNISQSYLYVPMCLYASFIFLDRPTIIRFIGVVLSFTVLLSCTFFPTTIVAVIAIYALIFGYIWHQEHLSYKQNGLFLVIHGFAFVFSILLLAFLYFPILENIKSTGILDVYENRIFFFLHHPGSMHSFFSSSLIFESYNAMESSAKYWLGGAISVAGNTTYHFGVVALVLAVSGLNLKNNKYAALVFISGACAILVVLRLYEVNGMLYVMSHIPIVGKIGCQYWWGLLVFPLMILMGFGVKSIEQQANNLIPVIFILGVGVWGTYGTYKLFGLHEPNLEYKLGVIILTAMTAAITIILLVSIKSSDNKNKRNIIIASIIAIMFIELIANSKSLRFPRNDYFDRPAAAISWVKEHVGQFRTVNIGQTGLYSELSSAFLISESTTMNQGTLPAYLDYFYGAIKISQDQLLGYTEATPRGAFPTLVLVQDRPQSSAINWRALNLLGVKYILLPVNYLAYKEFFKQQGLKVAYETSETIVFENMDVLPRAFSIPISVESKKNNVDLPQDLKSQLTPVKIKKYKNTKVVLLGVARQQEIVVLSDNWHQNWSATLNGKAVEILQVNGTFRGIVVPYGEYRIVMRYRPKTLSVATIITFSCISLAFLALIFNRLIDRFLNKRWPEWAS